MSNTLAIAAVTMTLQYILQTVSNDPELNDATVTILPLDKARGTNTANQINLFLYMMSRNATWTNVDIPRQVRPGETGIPPLPLNMYFLITAFGRDDDATQPFGHQLLGRAMSVLHDSPVLSAADIQAATQASLPGNNLAQQLERVRLTLHPLSMDELSKLWTGFSAQLRLSAAYEVGPVLIESTRPTRTPLPVLTRGAKDQGFTAQASLRPTLPTLTGLTLPNSQASARLGDTLTLSGVNLDGTTVTIVFQHELFAMPVAVPPDPGATGKQVQFTLPVTQPDAWPAGVYSVSVLVQRPGETFQRTAVNEQRLELAPSITITPSSAPAGPITFSITVTPQVWPKQRATLLLGDQPGIEADAHPTKTGTLTFTSTGLTAGEYMGRLRVDGVDSLFFDRSKTPPIFDPTKKVILT
jgi:hypothetical protein